MNSKITISKAEEILRIHFEIKGSAYYLPGERDANFRIDIKGQAKFILKISSPAEDLQMLNFQEALLNHLAKTDSIINTPILIPNEQGDLLSFIEDEVGNKRYLRLLSWVPGRIWAKVNPKLDDLRFTLGQQCGSITNALTNFDHAFAHRRFDWDIAQSKWTEAHLDLFDVDKQVLLSYFLEQFEEGLPRYNKLRKSVVHNDANDYNILVSDNLVHPKVTALIDFGDAIHTQLINDLAIACAYACMNQEDPMAACLPIVQGYHEAFPLLEEELVHLYTAVAMRLVVSVTKSGINKLENPENKYLLISEKPAWDLLKKWREINPDFAHYSFRSVCGFTPHPDETKFLNWSKKQKFELADLFPTIGLNLAHHLDLSVGSSWIGHEKEFNNLDLFQFRIEQLQKKNPHAILAGGYVEPRAIYTSNAYDKIGNNGAESRSIHLGVDFWLPSKTPVRALFDGEIVLAVNDKGDKEYGGLIVLKHEEEDLIFYTLYGHLTVASALQYKLGTFIKKGSVFADLGNYPENGNWAPHLHFQIMLSMLNYTEDFPGVTYPKQIKVWKSICPDPNFLFKLPALEVHQTISNNELIDYRTQHLGKGLSLQYQEPIRMVRGAGVYLIDQLGKKYLDTVNNVAHVGHEDYNVVKAGQQQMALLNTNSRYLHENINELAASLLATLPKELSVIYFVNSGSEANELALRMAKTFTGEKDIIAAEVGYHGNTNSCVDISSYKFDGKGGNGAPEHTHIFPLPDTFRGKYRGEKAAAQYAQEIEKLIDFVHSKKRKPAALIVEPIISCGGQVELPKGFLNRSYTIMRSAGGICISDEVQTGCGRMGKTFWGFQLHDVIPDIVTIGKPLGNGHPVAAVVCTPAIAEAFANGMEYFNTFGGNPVSCAIANEVLETVRRDNLQAKALNVGNYLKIELNKLADEFNIIGDIRGQGLFLGVELVDADLNPMADQATYLVNRMKVHGILMSIDGVDHNVIKIKPPLVFNKAHADELIVYLQKILAEDYMIPTKLKNFEE